MFLAEGAGWVKSERKKMLSEKEGWYVMFWKVKRKSEKWKEKAQIERRLVCHVFGRGGWVVEKWKEIVKRKVKRKSEDWKKAGMSCFWQGGLGGWHGRQVHFYRYSASSGGDVKDCPRHNILSLRTICTKFGFILYKIKWFCGKYTFKHCQRHNGPRNWLCDFD